MGVDVNDAHPEIMSTARGVHPSRTPVVPCYLLDNGADPQLLSDFDSMTPAEAAAHVGLNQIRQGLEES